MKKLFLALFAVFSVLTVTVEAARPQIQIVSSSTVIGNDRPFHLSVKTLTLAQNDTGLFLQDSTSRTPLKPSDFNSRTKADNVTANKDSLICELYHKRVDADTSDLTYQLDYQLVAGGAYWAPSAAVAIPTISQSVYTRTRTAWPLVRGLSYRTRVIQTTATDTVSILRQDCYDK